MARVSPEPEQIVEAGSPHSQGASTADARREPPEGEAAVLRPERPREHADQALPYSTRAEEGEPGPAGLGPVIQYASPDAAQHDVRSVKHSMPILMSTSATRL